MTENGKILTTKNDKLGWELILDCFVTKLNGPDYNPTWSEWNGFQEWTNSTGYEIEYFELGYSKLIGKQAYVRFVYTLAENENELFSAAARVQDDNLSDEERELNEEDWENYIFEEVLKANKTRGDWENQEPLSGQCLGESITIKPVTVEETCFVNMTHEHQYLGVQVEVILNVRMENGLSKVEHLIDQLPLITDMAFNAFMKKMEIP